MVIKRRQMILKGEKVEVNNSEERNEEANNIEGNERAGK